MCERAGIGMLLGEGQARVLMPSPRGALATLAALEGSGHASRSDQCRGIGRLGGDWEATFSDLAFVSDFYDSS